MFSEQNYGLVGWLDRIATHSLVDPEPYEASFSVEFSQALNGHATCVIKDLISSLEVAEGCYHAFCSRQGSHVVLSIDWVAQEGRGSALDYTGTPRNYTW